MEWLYGPTCRHLILLSRVPSSHIRCSVPPAVLPCCSAAPAAEAVNALQAHPFFAGVDWDALAGAQAPYVPTVTHELDTQNFEEFEEKEPSSAAASNRRRLRADPNFIGYTYKNWEAVSPREGEPCLFH